LLIVKSMATLARRRFLQSVGAAAVAAPFLALSRSRVARAATGGAKRLVVFFTPNGTIHSKWRPSGSGAAFDFPAGSILEPLAARKSDLLVLGGIDFKNVSNHEAGMANMLTGGGSAGTASGGMSVDQYVADRIGADSRFASLEFGVQTSAWGQNVQTRMSYRGPGQYVPPNDDPRNAFSRMFGDVAPTPGGVDRQLARRRSIIDLVRGELRDLGGRLGGEERRKLDQHLESLRRVEVGLGGGGAPAAGCGMTPAPTGGDVYGNDAFPTVGRQQTDLLVAALACGLTKVASLQWSHTVGPPVFSWVGCGDGHHSLSHTDDGNRAGVDQFVAAERWFAEQFRYLLDQLAQAPDPAGGSLLDSTLVVWCKELGDGRLHDCNSVPFVLAGGGGGLRTGRYLELGGAPHQKLLVSICQAMGLDNQTFGDASHGAGPLEGLV
jgi:hypothetical protein